MSGTWPSTTKSSAASALDRRRHLAADHVRPDAGQPPRTCGSISRAYQSTASTFGGCWKPPMNTMPAPLPPTARPSATASCTFDSEHHARRGRELCQHRLLDLRHDERHVGLARSARAPRRASPRGDRRRASPPSSAASRSSRRKCRSTVSNTTRALRREPAHRVDVLRGDVVARQHDDVELAAALHQQLGDRSDVRMEQHLDAALLQRADVRLLMLEVVGDERHLAAQRRRDLEHRLHAQRARVLVGRAACTRRSTSIRRSRPAVALELGAHAVRLDAPRARRAISRRTSPG